MSLSPEEREVLNAAVDARSGVHTDTDIEYVWIAAKNYGMRQARDLLVDLHRRESDASLQKGIELVSIVINVDKHG